MWIRYSRRSSRRMHCGPNGRSEEMSMAISLSRDMSDSTLWQQPADVWCCGMVWKGTKHGSSIHGTFFRGQAFQSLVFLGPGIPGSRWIELKMQTSFAVSHVQVQDRVSRLVGECQEMGRERAGELRAPSAECFTRMRGES